MLIDRVEGVAQLKVVFVGTPEFADASLKALLASRHEVIAVVTQPDRPAGRGMRICCTPVKQTAQAHCIPVMQPERIADEEVVDKLRRLSPDAIVVVAYGQKIPVSILEVPKYGCINVHGSLLPEYRGAAPIHRAIMDGKDYTGVTTMYMDEGWDTGDVILSKTVRIHDSMTAGELHDVLAEEGAKLLVKTLDLIEEGRAPRIPQDHSKATYAPKICKDDCCIDWSMSAENIRNIIRGLNPFPGAVSALGNIRLKLWEARLKPDLPEDYDRSSECGQIVMLPERPGDGLTVRCGLGYLEITKLQPENRKCMSAYDFTLGYSVLVGQKFCSPEQVLRR